MRRGIQSICSIAILVYNILESNCCSDMMATRAATESDANIITYSADGLIFGALYFHRSGEHSPSEKIEIYDWIYKNYLGEIDEVSYTYQTMGNMNEHGVAIGESTCGLGLPHTYYPGSIMDYGNLIYITLQRAKGAREAVSILTDLAQEYGYVSGCESISIADQEEIWYLELVNKGREEKGIVWVALRIPDGYVSAHANQARITTFNISDTQHVMCSPDVISFAREHKLIPPDLPDEDFSFSDTYDPLNPFKTIYSESRVWSFFNHIVSGMDEYIDYIKGVNMSHRMPLWVKPSHKLSLEEIMGLMRDHFEGTWLDPTKDVGAQAYSSPYRVPPPLFDYSGDTYLHRRTIGIFITFFHMVAQLRPNMPPPIGAILWFGVDDATTSVHFPVYAGLQSSPWNWALGNGDIMNLNYNSAFWVFNLLANYIYPRYSIIYPDVNNKILELEGQFMAEVKDIDTQALNEYNTNPAAAIETVSEYTLRTGEYLVQKWLEFYGEIFVKYVDGYRKTVEGGEVKVATPGYGEDWYKRIVAATGNHYKLPTHYTNTNTNIHTQDSHISFINLLKKGKI